MHFWGCLPISLTSSLVRKIDRQEFRVLQTDVTALILRKICWLKISFSNPENVEQLPRNLLEREEQVKHGDLNSEGTKLSEILDKNRNSEKGWYLFIYCCCCCLEFIKLPISFTVYLALVSFQIIISTGNIKTITTTTKE